MGDGNSTRLMLLHILSEFVACAEDNHGQLYDTVWGDPADSAEQSPRMEKALAAARKALGK